MKNDGEHTSCSSQDMSDMMVHPYTQAGIGATCPRIGTDTRQYVAFYMHIYVNPSDEGGEGLTS
jgi:hypothetical protein